MSFVDRNGVHLSIGARVHVHRPRGAHGQMETIEGKIMALYDNPPSVTLLLLAAYRREFKNVVEYLERGAGFFVALPGRWNGEQFTCDTVHDDIEHSFHAWAEVQK